MLVFYFRVEICMRFSLKQTNERMNRTTEINWIKSRESGACDEIAKCLINCQTSQINSLWFYSENWLRCARMCLRALAVRPLTWIRSIWANVRGLLSRWNCFNEKYRDVKMCGKWKMMLDSKTSKRERRGSERERERVEQRKWKTFKRFANKMIVWYMCCAPLWLCYPFTNRTQYTHKNKTFAYKYLRNMDIKWEWIIIVVCDAAVAVDIVDVVVSIIGGGGGASAATAPALLFNKLTEPHSALCIVELRIKWNEPETMYIDRYTKWACRLCANTHSHTRSHHKIALSTIDKFIWRAFFSRSGKNFVHCVVLSGQIVSVWLADTQTSAISYNVKHLDYLDSFFSSPIFSFFFFASRTYPRPAHWANVRR